MSTRCHVKIKSEFDTVCLYRHSDGYPDCTGKDLADFIQGYLDGSMRDDAMQSAGWLIVRGHQEYLSDSGDGHKLPTFRPSKKGYSCWKVGSYEPTSSIHGDEEYIYVLDLDDKLFSCHRPKETKKGYTIGKQLFSFPFETCKQDLENYLNKNKGDE